MLVQVVDVSGQVQLMVVSFNKEFLYVGVCLEFCVLVYCIMLDNGVLIFVGEVVLLGSLIYIFIDCYGCFVFSVFYNQGCVSVILLYDGLLGEIIIVVEGLEGCYLVNIFLDNCILWVLVLKQDCICLFIFSDDGFFLVQEFVEVMIVEGVGLCYMVFYFNQQYGYCVNELNSLIDVWELKDFKGNIECVQILDMMLFDFSGVCWVVDIYIILDGCYFYVCDCIVSIIMVFSVLEDGSVLVVEGYQFIEIQLCGFNFDYSGKYFIVVGQKLYYIVVYDIVGEQGLLQEKGCYVVGQGLMWVVVNVY